MSSSISSAVNGSIVLGLGASFPFTFGARGPGTNGAETIRFGLRGLSMSKGLGTIELADGAELTAHDRPDDTVIRFNTLVNNERDYAAGDRVDLRSPSRKRRLES